MTLSQLCNLSQLPLPHQRTTPCFLFLGTDVIKDRQCFKPAQFLIFISVTLDPAFNSSWSLKEDSCQSQDCSNLLHKPTVPHGVPMPTPSNPLHWQFHTQLLSMVFQPVAFQLTQNWSMSNFIQPPTLNPKPRDAVIDACGVALLQIFEKMRL